MDFYQIDLRLFSQINGAGHHFNDEMPEYLCKIAFNIKQYDKLLNRKVSKYQRKKVFVEIIKQLNICKTHWCSHMVRHLKKPDVKEAYNKMYDQLFFTISTMRKNLKKLSRIEKRFLDSVIYTGLLHREIGYPLDFVSNNFQLKLEFDDSYCSWNANNDVDKIHHIRDGDKYNIRITAKATSEHFGFSITGFNLFYNKNFSAKNRNMPNEDEVVLKLTKESVISTEKVLLKLKK